MIITNNDKLAHGCRLVRNHGEAVEGTERTYFSDILGWNYRMTELEAAVGIEQLKKLDKMNKKRKELAAYLTDGLKEIKGIAPHHIESYVTSSFYFYGMNYDAEKVGVDRETFVKAVRAEGIPLTSGYPPQPLYMNKPFQEKSAYGRGCPFNCRFYEGNVDYSKGSCPNAEEATGKTLLLRVIRPPATFKDMDDIADAIKKVANNINQLKDYNKK